MDIPEESIHVEDCTCDHDEEQHGWDACKVEGCDCKGHLTE